MSKVQAWLLEPFPRSAFQAYCQNVYTTLIALRKNPLSLMGMIFITFLIFCAIFADFLAPYAPNDINLALRLQASDSAHWLGTDELGRDILSRLIYGTRITFLIVLMVSLLAAPLGLLLGTASGYFGGILDRILMRGTDIVLTFPKLILALAFMAVLGPRLENVIFVMVLTSWAPYARVARTEAVRLRHAEFIQMASLQGMGKGRILLKYIMPLCLPSVIVRMSLDMAGVILTAAVLGFLGVGAPPPLPEWGAMSSSGTDYLLHEWWVATIPGILILLTSLAFNFIGDGLRDILDPSFQERGS
jgi:peptide/nickel transport system permease protein